MRGHSETANVFEIQTPAGQPLVTASVSDQDLEAGRERWREATHSLALLAVAITVLLLAAPLLDWRNRTRRPGPYLTASVLAAVAILVGRILLRVASPADWSDAEIFSGAAYASPLVGSFLTSPFDFLADALAAGGIVAIAGFAIEEWRVYRWTRRRPIESNLPAFILDATAGRRRRRCGARSPTRR